jgi:hypothetical protein
LELQINWGIKEDDTINPVKDTGAYFSGALVYQPEESELSTC